LLGSSALLHPLPAWVPAFAGMSGRGGGQKKSRARRRGSSLGRKRPGRAETSATSHERQSRVRRTIDQAKNALPLGKTAAHFHFLRIINILSCEPSFGGRCCIAITTRFRSF